MSQRHFKIGKAISTRTKSISLFTLLLSIVMISFSFRAIDSEPASAEVLLSETPITTQGYFVQEEIPGKYKLLKAVIDGDEIILRPDRIELLFKKTKMEESSYLLFDNSNKNAQPTGINIISESMMPIQNKAMAEVLKATTMKVTKFEQVKYSNLYDGVDLLLTIGENGLKASVVSKDRMNAASKFKMSVLADTEVANNSGDLNFRHKRGNSNMMIKSKNKNLNFNNSNKLQFSETEDASGDLNFDIILN